VRSQHSEQQSRQLFMMMMMMMMTGQQVNALSLLDFSPMQINATNTMHAQMGKNEFFSALTA
jgi:hypothetical protein